MPFVLSIRKRYGLICFVWNLLTRLLNWISIKTFWEHVHSFWLVANNNHRHHKICNCSKSYIGVCVLFCIVFRLSLPIWMKCYGNTHEENIFDIWRPIFLSLVPIFVLIQGEDIFKELYNAVKERGIKMRITQNAPTKQSPQNDSAELAKIGIVTS